MIIKIVGIIILIAVVLLALAMLFTLCVFAAEAESDPEFRKKLNERIKDMSDE